MAEQTQDHHDIRAVIDEWAISRDGALWERFRKVWHPRGVMMATWFQGSADEFATISQRGFERGVNILHFLGGTSIELAGDRAVAQTKMQILQRAVVHGVEVDVTCHGRFHDLFERTAGDWRLVLRRLTYEKDWVVPVDPSARLSLDPRTLERFPVGYRHLAYVQSELGFDVHDNMPGISGPETDHLYEQARRWLAGENVATLAASVGGRDAG
ncbi:nuclear transport factor 2 family protein [Egicoccus sp. AB-alg6-2]|uniref:nuclear transport factor 2 family protein n=1 Tax=Egicoccus sp. AB-alg6-2 TaxID=3242692 RepID=UPI00359DDECC